MREDSGAFSALDSSLAAVHSPYYLERWRPLRLKRAVARGGGGKDALMDEAQQYDSVFLALRSGAAARRAALASMVR